MYWKIALFLSCFCMLIISPKVASAEEYYDYVINGYEVEKCTIDYLFDDLGYYRENDQIYYGKNKGLVEGTFFVSETSYFVDGRRPTGTALLNNGCYNALYVNGKAAKGHKIYKGKLYVNGVVQYATKYKNKLYYKGKVATDQVFEYKYNLYKGQKLYKGMHLFKLPRENNVKYAFKNGRPYDGIYKNSIYSSGHPFFDGNDYMDTLTDVLYSADGKSATIRFLNINYQYAFLRNNVSVSGGGGKAKVTYAATGKYVDILSTIQTTDIHVSNLTPGKPFTVKIKNIHFDEGTIQFQKTLSGLTPALKNHPDYKQYAPLLRKYAYTSKKNWPIDVKKTFNKLKNYKPRIKDDTTTSKAFIQFESFISSAANATEAATKQGNRPKMP